MLRPMLIAATLLAQAAAVVAFIAAPLAGEAYLLLAGGVELPALTRQFLLPLLRAGPGATAWAWLCWGALLPGPAAVGAWSLLAASRERTIERWIAGASLYAAFAALLAALAFGGAVLPFAPL